MSEEKDIQYNEENIHDKELWACQVGKFLLFFAEIENSTYFALKYLPSDDIFEPISKLRFSSRVDLIKRLINAETKIPETLANKTIGLLNKAKQLSEKRNIIAHSPLGMKIFEHPFQGWRYVDETFLANLRNAEKAISFDELLYLASTAEQLSKNLSENINRIIDIKSPNQN